MITRSDEETRVSRLVLVLVNWKERNSILSEMLGVSESCVRGMRAELKSRHDLPEHPDNREFNGKKTALGSEG